MGVFEAATGRSWHRLFTSRDQTWSGTRTGAFSLPRWGGTTFKGTKQITVPDGEYVIRISVLRALGDASNPAHWDVWTSPRFVIDRPNLVVSSPQLSQNSVAPDDDVTITAAISNRGAD